MGRRTRGGLSGKKIIGLILAVAGAFIVIDMVPIYVWKILIGTGLLVSGWLLFNS